MMIAVTVIHVLTCFLLVVIVLLQTGKGADMGAVFGGGSSSTIFGSSGAGNLLTRVTTGAAVVFMGTSLTLAYNASSSSPAALIDKLGGVEQTAPAADAAGEVVAEDVVVEEEVVAADAKDAAAPAAEAPKAEAPAAAAGAGDGAAAEKAAPDAAAAPPDAAPAAADTAQP